MVSKTQIIALFILIVMIVSHSLYGQEKQNQGPPPAQVVVAAVGSGKITPENEFIGTLYYQEVSDVASEVSGIVSTVHFEEGRAVTKGQALVELTADLLQKSLKAAVASYEQARSEMKKAEKDYERAKSLYEQELVSEQTYDDNRFNAEGMKKRVASLQADVERIETELLKKTIYAPFDGIVLKKHTERGEWLSPGSKVATVAAIENVDVIADVTEPIVRHIKQGMDVKVSSGGELLTGTVIALIPNGDVSTRTFPVKIRVHNNGSLAEGMEARVTLPTGEKEHAFTVPRDALITAQGSTLVYIAEDGKAKMIPVKVVGYDGMTAGVLGQGLEEGMKVVVEGNERLRDGQPVIIQSSQ
jgi:membrane fusion protein (multidrug efflux system)